MDRTLILQRCYDKTNRALRVKLRTSDVPCGAFLDDQQSFERVYDQSSTALYAVNAGGISPYNGTTEDARQVIQDALDDQVGGLRFVLVI